MVRLDEDKNIMTKAEFNREKKLRRDYIGRLEEIASRPPLSTYKKYMVKAILEAVEAI